MDKQISEKETIDKRRITITTQFKVNNQIRASQVRLIDEDSTQIGTMAGWEALRVAQERGLDLVEISPQGNPPVCKLMNYGKYLFEEKIKEKAQQRTQRLSQVDLKEIQVSPVIQDGDLNVKINNIKRIFDGGDKVRIVIKFSGRQLKHIDFGKEIFDKIIAALPEARIEKQPSFEGRNLSMIIFKNADVVVK